MATAFLPSLKLNSNPCPHLTVHNADHFCAVIRINRAMQCSFLCGRYFLSPGYIHLTPPDCCIPAFLDCRGSWPTSLHPSLTSKPPPSPSFKRANWCQRIGQGRMEMCVTLKRFQVLGSLPANLNPKGGERLSTPPFSRRETEAGRGKESAHSGRLPR